MKYLINSNGPRIHAQRKFAQGATAVFSNTGLSSVPTNFTPAITPTKDSNKFKKRVLTPISPPLKRPKTEDFLTFLCFRGTSALPPDLDYFSYPQPLQVEDVHIQTKKLKDSAVSTSTGSTNTDSSQNVSSCTGPPVNGGPSRNVNSKTPTEASLKANLAASNRNGKASATKLLKGSKSSAVTLKKPINGVSVSSISASVLSAKNGVSERKVTKAAKKVALAAVPAPVPQISPSASRINEQDARFAMTALKLKYQEKRLANARPAKSLITMLTKKVKERSMVLTRSRAKTAVGPLKTSPIRKKVLKPPVARPPVKPLSRNAPSPDIILGVAQSPVKPVDSRRSSSSDSESSSTESKKSSSSSESSSSSSSESEDEPTTRSLRNGKEVVTKPKPDRKPATKKSAPGRRIGTRAAHRNTKSPLRELPMWNVNVKKKKILAKYKKNAKTKATKNAMKRPSPPNSSLGHVTRSSSKKPSGFTKGRPSRKTKETAAIYLGLLNKDFSSDNEGSSDDSDEDGRSSSVGDSSASETKFLEKSYNASLKRTNQPDSRSSSSSRVRSSQQSKKASSSKEKTKKNYKSSKQPNDKKNQKESKKKKEEKPMRRVLRSQSGGSMDNSKAESPAISRRRLLMMQCGKDTAMAARKSAKIVSRGRSRRQYSSSSDGDSRESSSDSEVEDDAEDDNDKQEENESASDPASASSDEEPEEKPEVVAANKRRGTESPMSIPSSRGSKAKTKRITELIKENRKRDSSLSSTRSSLNSSPTERRAASVSSKVSESVTETIEKQEEDEEEEEDEEGDEEENDTEEEEEKVEDDEEEEENEDEDEDVEDQIQEVEDEEEDELLDIPTSPMESLPVPISESPVDEEMDEDNDDDPQTVESHHHSDSASTVESSVAESESEAEEEQGAPTPPPPPLKVSISTQCDLDEEEEEERRLKAEVEEPPTISSIELPLSQQQQAELQEAEEEDDEIQEIGQVIKNPHTIYGNARRTSRPPSPISEPQHNIPHNIPLPEAVPLTIPASMPPLNSRASSMTYTSHHVNLAGNPYSVPYSRPSDYYPPLFGPALVNQVHLIGSASGPGLDFGSELANPLSTLSIPVSTLTGFPTPLMPPGPPLCLGSAASMTTSMQTHIRTVAATNMDIPLVRPVVGPDPNMYGHMGMGQPSHMGSSVGAMNSFLSRPVGPWSQPAPDVRSHHYSAFRHPTMQVVSSAPPVLPTSTLPVSIVPPRTLPHQHQHHVGQPVPVRAPVHHHSISTTHTHVVHNIREIHHHHHASSTATASAYMQNYPESIIRNLPNCSIVPKFDRSSVKTQLPSQQASSSGSSSSKKHSSSKTEEQKKSKKKKPATLPIPSSPLTVRKDSSNPATYIGLSTKLKKKLDLNDSRPEESAPTPSSSSSTSSSSSKKKDAGDSTKDSTKFDMLLQLKQERKTGSPSSVPKQSAGEVGRSSPAAARKSEERPRTPEVQIKQEVITVSPIKKSHSPCLHRKTPDRPSSSSSAHSSNKGHSAEDKEKRKESNGSSSSSSSKKPTSKLLEAPTYYPSEQDFEDPLKYFDKIQPEAEKFGMARIVPPRSFRPECNVNDDMRFTAYNHYIHKMYKRWGPTVQETEGIKEHLKRSEVDLSSIPVIGGLEIDFSTLYQAVLSFGGIKEVMEKSKWADVADCLHIPKGTHDRASKLDAAYVKYILPYDLLSEDERSNLKSQVQDKWIRRQQKLQERTGESSDDEDSDEDSMDELDDCVIKGKGTPLSSYYRVARNTVGMIFSNGKEPSIPELEDEYWKIVREGKKHLCVYSGSIDCAGVGWGFPAPKASSKHPWNLKVLANNAGSVLRSMGPVMGATVPTLHVSMLFTSYCWYRDPHGLPWVEYIHSGASKIWYSVASIHGQLFRKALTKLMPLQCKNKKLWLPSDSAMVPPELLIENGVPLVRAVQNPGEFLVVFPKSYTSAICAGYLVSESVCFAPPMWLKSCMETFKESVTHLIRQDIRESREPPVFPVEKLLLSIVRDNKVSTQVIKMAAPLAEKVITEELSLRKKLQSMGVSFGGKLNKNDSGKGISKKKRPSTEEEYEQCNTCNYILQMSLVRNDRTDFVTCLPHAIQHLSRHKAQIKKCTLLCEETQEELESLLQTAKRRANS
ncbi:Protein Jumonji [Orchesella cincta]|uniref:Protein Jumonji n=1 Tax=Orchesella cincta TaxID=48709 RepID=A0A1D2M9U6_ORCCI|nr:Protein Jumonji [Orchesella cincta]